MDISTTQENDDNEHTFGADLLQLGTISSFPSDVSVSARFFDCLRSFALSLGSDSSSVLKSVVGGAVLDCADRDDICKTGCDSISTSSSVTSKSLSAATAQQVAESPLASTLPAPTNLGSYIKEQVSFFTME